MEFCFSYVFPARCGGWISSSSHNSGSYSLPAKFSLYAFSIELDASNSLRAISLFGSSSPQENCLMNFGCCDCLAYDDGGALSLRFAYALTSIVD